nr:MAG TPA: Endomembrane protein 70 [Caudoviricetes sp.]DAP73746.1 MAG TPA: Endomembrane protein 70 [Caudoviricetes sp.]
MIVPFADLFRIDCEYCWWWRGFFVGSIATTLVFLLIYKLMELL